jgi:uncharacterized OB-fold protein
MMSKPFEIPGKWEIEYKYAAGPYISKFLEGLKEKKIFGIKCNSCKRVYVPPRMFCERCYVELNDWVEVKETGTLETFIVVYRKFYGLPDPPYALGLIKLDGASESFLHYLGEVDLSRPEKIPEILKQGQKVIAIWNEERKGSILDIKYFKPL